jgi:hypothetical protein|mmetsp:Transcript_43015/g.72556  ORF Transcript_43015/g.72556 Transcript_43015/m.72556 type:complete len:85 (+) Transcript_43015:1658-1912(+)
MTETAGRMQDEDYLMRMARILISNQQPKGLDKRICVAYRFLSESSGGELGGSTHEHSLSGLYTGALWVTQWKTCPTSSCTWQDC